MVGKAAMLIKSKNEEGALPLGRVTNSLIDAFDEVFSRSNWRRWVEGLIRAAFRVEVGELWKISGCCIGVKLFKRLIG